MLQRAQKKWEGGITKHGLEGAVARALAKARDDIARIAAAPTHPNEDAGAGAPATGSTVLVGVGALATDPSAPVVYRNEDEELEAALAASLELGSTVSLGDGAPTTDPSAPTAHHNEDEELEDAVVASALIFTAAPVVDLTGEPTDSAACADGE